MNKINIVLADDHAVLRSGLKLLINEQPDMEVIGEAGDGSSAVRLVLTIRPDLVVMDVSMPNMNGQFATQQLKRALSEIKVLALTRHSDNGYLQEMLRYGVDGYVLKQSNPEELIRAIRAIIEGGKYIDPAITEKLLSGYEGRVNNRSDKGAVELSEREADVLRLIAQGYSNKEVAAHFDLSIKTIEAHKANAMKKLELQNRVEIIRYAIFRGWLQDS